MSRIYESQQAGVNFEGQSRGGSFNPQKAADNTKQLEQKAAAKNKTSAYVLVKQLVVKRWTAWSWTVSSVLRPVLWH